MLRLTDVYEQDGRETGLMGFCLHPEFPNIPYVFVSYNYLQSARILGKVVRYTYNLDTLINPEVILDSIPGANIHTGSRLAFGPDGKLYITTGDAANPQIAQNLQSIAGKILRINPDGSIPADNPFPGRAVWSFGHRNPQGLVWAENNLLYSSEHGAQTDDEVNVILKGRNYGWPHVEGYCDAPNERLFCRENDVVEPIKAYTPTIAVAGLAYYNHNVIPEWKNSLLMVTLNARGMDLRQLQLSALGDSVLSENIYFDQEWGRLRGICVSPWGAVFISTSNRDGRGTPGAGDDKIIEIFNPLVTGNHSLLGALCSRSFCTPTPLLLLVPRV